MIAVFEVALGNLLKRREPDYTLSPEKLQKEKCHATHGVGTNTPTSNTVINNIIIPNGKLGLGKEKTFLIYDEFVFYNINQYKMKYLLVLKNNIKNKN